MNERERAETEDLAAELAEALTYIRVLERQLGRHPEGTTLECPACGEIHTGGELERSLGQCPKEGDEAFLCSGGAEDAPCARWVRAEGDLCFACLRDRQARERGAK